MIKMKKRISLEERADIAVKKRRQVNPFFHIGTRKLKIIGKLVKQGGLWLIKEIVSEAKGVHRLLKMTALEILEAIDEYEHQLKRVIVHLGPKIPVRRRQLN